MDHAYLHFGQGDEPRQTVRVEARDAPLWWHRRGLSYSASGYGARIPSPLAGRPARTASSNCATNAGTAYIGKPGAWLATVSEGE